MSSDGTPFHRPIWDRGEAIDAQMLRFTVGDDWLHDRRLVPYDLAASRAHAAGLFAAGLLAPEDHAALERGLQELATSFAAGAWTVEEGDEDVHSAVERRLIVLVGEPGKRLHTGRSRNEQVAVDVRLWLRDASVQTRAAARALSTALRALAARTDLPLPGYTHLRRAMPSTVALWAEAHAAALDESLAGFAPLDARLRCCPLGSGAGYGVPLQLDRALVASLLGFDAAEDPVTLTQHTRGRAELAYATALEALALDLGKLAADLWLFTTEEFGFARLPVALTTGSSMMPQKRNPDVLELLRAESRQVVADRAALLDALRDLPSGYHRDFQTLKPPLFRAHDRASACLGIAERIVGGLAFDAEALARASSDPALRATERALARTREGVPFRDAYVAESRGSGAATS